MRTSQACGGALAAPLFALGIGLAVVPTASADPNIFPPPPPAPGAPPAPAPTAFDAPAGPIGAPNPIGAPVPEGGDPAVAACSQFAGALDTAATYYSDFANNISGDAPPNFDDPIVRESNVWGRTALRQAAAQALDASATPGLQPDIAAPMQSWSFNAAQLVVMMGVRAPRDAVNAKATEMNKDTENAQMACANAGTHA